MHTCVVGIGSNYNSEESLRLAHQSLTALFPGTYFGEVQETEPLFFKNPALFSNQLAVFQTSMNCETVIASLKKIERDAGRKPGDKLEEKVILDLDLIRFDAVVLRPDEMTKEYIVRGMKQLNLL